MKERSHLVEPNQRSASQSPVEIPPQQNRKHLTDPSWIESMIHFTGLYLEREVRAKEKAAKEKTEESGEENPPKSEAA